MLPDFYPCQVLEKHFTSRFIQSGQSHLKQFQFHIPISSFQTVMNNKTSYIYIQKHYGRIHVVSVGKCCGKQQFLVHWGTQ